MAIPGREGTAQAGPPAVEPAAKPAMKPAAKPAIKPAAKPAIEIDALLRRVERTALVVCVVMAAAAFGIGGGRILPVLAVAAGGLLALVSYRMIVSSAEGLVGMLAPSAAADGEPAETEAAGRPSPVLVLRVCLTALHPPLEQRDNPGVALTE